MQINMDKYSGLLDIIQVMTGETKKGDIYQGRRFMTSLEKRGLDTEAASLEEKLKTAQSALMLTPAESVKLPTDQLKAPVLFIVFDSGPSKIPTESSTYIYILM